MTKLITYLIIYWLISTITITSVCNSIYKNSKNKQFIRKYKIFISIFFNRQHEEFFGGLNNNLKLKEIEEKYRCIHIHFFYQEHNHILNSIIYTKIIIGNNFRLYGKKLIFVIRLSCLWLLLLLMILSTCAGTMLFLAVLSVITVIVSWIGSNFCQSFNNFDWQRWWCRQMITLMQKQNPVT